MNATRTWRLAAFGLSASLSATPAMAGPAELRTALERVPAQLLMKPDALLAGFIDLSDLGRLPAFRAADPARLADRLYPAMGSETVQALVWNDRNRTEETWREKTGTGFSDLASFLVFGMPPRTVTIWHLNKAGGAEAFLAGLESRGFTKAADGSLGNGEPFKVNPARRSYGDPFAGPLGRASTLAPAAGGVAQSHDPAAIAALRAATEPGFAGLPPVAAALDGIEKVFGDARLPQALVLGLQAWTPDMARAILDRDPATPPRLPEPGAPLAAAAIVADVETTEPARRGAAFAIGYPDCATAAKANAHFAQTWRETADAGGKTPRERTGAEPMTREIESGAGCAAVIALTVPAAEGAGNPVYRYILDAVMRRDLKALQGK